MSSEDDIYFIVYHLKYIQVMDLQDEMAGRTKWAFYVVTKYDILYADGCTVVYY